MSKKSIFITGAGAGIGAATARLFAESGWQVGLFDQNFAAVAKLAQEIGSDRAMAGSLNVGNAQQWQSALDAFVSWAGQLDVLLNNAGILYSGAFENTRLVDHVRTMQVNINGVLNGCHSAFPHLKANPHGARVINLSSASAIYGQTNLASYSASKFAVRGLTEALDGEWKTYQIRVMDIMPMFVQTAMVTNMDAGSIKKMGVHLNADDVAQVIYKAATAHRMLAPTHWPVGLTSKAL
ncbi:MAG: SDR family oxidoreductase, partial [Pseudomonadota bacterium]|nr:SDR family oxidoreductase [Pseudomonadota bacterium]